MSRPSAGPWVGALLRLAWKGVRDHIEASVVQAGYSDLSSAHIALFRHPTLDGTRPTELAEQLWVSKQTINGLLGHLESQGYLRRQVDTNDRRSRIVRLTDAGERLEDVIRLAARDAEMMLERTLGPERFVGFREALIEATHTLSGELKRLEREDAPP